MRILVVGMADSVHLAKWLRQFSGCQFEFEIVSSSPHRRIHPMLEGLIEAGPQFRIHWVSRYLSLPLWIADRLGKNWLRGALIAWRGSVFRPDLVHVLEFQNGGYSYLRSRSLTRALDVPMLLTPYGSDIFWFQNFPSHLSRIRQLVTIAGGLSSECRRDELLASKYGFNGMLGPRLPASGGMSLSQLRLRNTSRHRIAIKGYQNVWGQALIALECIEEMAPEIMDFEITLFSCNWLTLRAANALARRTGLKVTAYGKGKLSNDQVHEILSQSVSLISLSKSDGVPASMLEAMANGAIPIQSNTSAADEWLDSEKSGFLVAWSDKEAVKRHLRKIIKDPDFRHSAAEANFKRLQVSIDSEKARVLALKTYEMFGRSYSL